MTDPQRKAGAMRMKSGLAAWSLARLAAIVLAATSLGGCGTIIAAYSLESYTNATKLKAETLAVIDAAKDPYAAHAEEVRKLQTDLSAAYEFSHGMPYNSEASAMWDIIRNPSETNSLLGEFFAIWRKRGTGLGDFYRYAKRKNIVFAFDRLICLEANKKAATKCPDYPTGTKPAGTAAEQGDFAKPPEEPTHG
jgi:hypothetical protein